MKEFFIGLLVLLIMLILTIVGIFLIPLIVVLGFFLKWVVSLVLIIFAIWLVGKAVLMSMDYAKREEKIRRD